MDHFTPVGALAGGLLIGTSAVLFLLLNGRIAGVSNITAGLLTPRRGDVSWRLVFLGGLVAGAAAVHVLSGDVATPRAGFPGWLLVVAGLLVGFGTSLGNGCTSGHGVCGLGRLSGRSLVATLTFLVAGIATTFVVRHVFGVP